MNEADNMNHDLSPLYREAARPEPPPALDAAILAAARNAVAAQAPTDPQFRAQNAAKKNRLLQWRLPLALAATVVLSVAITTMVRDQMPPDEYAFGTREAARASASIGEAGVANSSAKAASPAVVKPDADSLAKPQSNAEPLQQGSEPPAGPAYEPAPVAQQRKQSLADTAPDAVVSAPLRERASAGVGVGASVNADAANQSETPPAASRGALGAAASARLDSDKKAEAVMAAPSPAEKSALPTDLPGAPADRPPSDKAKSPEAAIAEIRKLRSAGRMTEAGARLGAFRRQFPDYSLPEDLRQRQ